MDAARDSTSEPGKPNAIRSKRRNWTEIGVAFALILAVEWAPRPWQRFLWLAAAIGIALIVWKSFDGWPAMGLRAANFGRSLWIVGPALVAAAAAILIAAKKHTLQLPDGPFAFVGMYCAYAIWTGVQQFLLQSFFLLRFIRVIRGEWQAALAAAVLFSLAHVPNPILVVVTLIWGFAACLLFLRYRNLYPLMIAHAILGITVAMTIPGPIVHNMRVGLGYLTYRSHAHARHVHRSWRSVPEVQNIKYCGHPERRSPRRPKSKDLY